MADARYETARVADLMLSSGWAPIRRALGVAAFGVNAWSARDGDAVVIPEHDEEPSGHEELYLVISGRAAFTVDGERVDAPVGTVIFVSDPAIKRAAVAVEPDTTVLAVGAKAGEAYMPRAWEVNAELIPLFDAGRHAEAKRVLLDALDRYDDRAILLYNLACAEAQLGELDAALEHLRAAIDQRPAFADVARKDDDLEPIRDRLDGV